MDLVKSDQEAMWFLMGVVHGGGGSFRIHSSKKGIKLFIEFENVDILGTINEYLPLYRPHRYHKDVFFVRPRRYYGSALAPTLCQALNKHIEDFDPGKFDQDYLVSNAQDQSATMSPLEWAEACRQTTWPTWDKAKYFAYLKKTGYDIK